MKLTGLTDKARAHWAYQPVKNPPVPEVKDKTWVKTPIDAFILAKLEANNMRPSKAASKEVLLRRAYYDLIGLPPSPEEVAEFMKDHSPNAFEKVVDRLAGIAATMANDGADSGSTAPAMPTPPAPIRFAAKIIAMPMPGRIGIMSSRHSTLISPTINS